MSNDNVQIEIDENIKKTLDIEILKQQTNDIKKNGDIKKKDNHLYCTSPPYTDSINVKNLHKQTLEKQLNSVRKKYEIRKNIESQLGLTPTMSGMCTPLNEMNNNTDEQLERKEEIGFRRRTFWKSCCGRIIDRRATQFFVQVFIGASVMVFCMLKIWQAVPLHGCTGEDTTVYFSLLSALVGFYIPSPSMNKQ